MPYKFKEIKQKLELLGFKIVRQKGSHVMFLKGKQTIPVPNHGGKDISPGVEDAIIKALGISRDFFKSLKK